MADTALLQDWHTPRLPWSRVPGERGRFAGILALTLLVFLPPAVLIPSVVLPEWDRAEVEEVPAHLARLVEAPEVKQGSEEGILLTPGASPEAADVKKAPDEQVHQTPSALPKKKGADESLHPTPTSPSPSGSPAGQTVEQARETASRSGLLAMKDRLASLRESPSEQVSSIAANVRTESGSKPAEPDRTEVLKGSGGVSNAQDPVAEVAMAGHEVKKVERKPEPAAQTLARGEPPSPKSSAGERAMSNIRKVFDVQKTALYSLYKRELRQDPTLAGKILLELVIEPDGTVSACEVVSSELKNPALEQRIAMRVRMFNFGADSVERRKVRFPVDFLPG
ncbi:AgmX/PglI C-terminal domain-containing protein [Marinobacter pelagius]|uniref:AgmX/PglI C-terminal domain-containing protein n=1 Tax=Marinobacter sp. C7 TaxID=2951363 RepID=UPI001EF02F7A|nr:AgmX/PglI C-terminal domain-containing protein [Marinobacter sp. C7]MCG7199508.1 AgmX/PglI C-terminal domain-containing protein [Marinobacter sp. C7]